MQTKINIEKCELCPRKCRANRMKRQFGYCNCSDDPLISSIFLHQGEEPVLSGTKGICNVFFAHCNLQCIYCQNHQISRNNYFEPSWVLGYSDIVATICRQLDTGIKLLGFVSPSHQVVQMCGIIEKLFQKGYHPRIVYNTNCYDDINTLKELEGIVDIYLPDFKYFDNFLGLKYSDVPDYFTIAAKAFKEMFRQKGSTLLVDSEGIAESGIIVRHLALPSHSDDSIRIFEFLAEEFSAQLHVSLMAQYYPTNQVKEFYPLNRTISLAEYSRVVHKVEEIGFRGWIQELSSSKFYQPDFSKNNPFGE